MPKYSNYQDVRSEIDQGIITTVDVVQYYLDQIEASKNLNVYVEVWAEEALSIAKEQDQRRAKGEKLGRLAGLVVSLKDVICYKDHQVTAASKILDGFTSLFSATAIERILAEDAIIIGRTNCDEFAMGSTNETSH